MGLESAKYMLSKILVNSSHSSGGVEGYDYEVCSDPRLWDKNRF